jgi:membrane protease YdiL (CAAX protease family)
MRVALAFAALCVSYHLPEAIGQRVLGSLSAVAALFLLFYVVAYAVARSLCRGRSALFAYALEPRHRIAAIATVAFALAVCLKMISVIVGLRLGIYTATAAQVPTAMPIAVSLAMTVVPSVAEDIVTRGFWFRAAGIRWRARTFIVASSAIYVANHVFRLGQGPGEWAMLFVFGIVYALTLVRIGSLWAAVGLHWGWNFGNELAALVWQAGVTSPAGTRALAIGSHMVMGLVVFLTTTAARRGHARDSDASN